MSNAEVSSSKTIGQVRRLIIKNQIYFVGKDVAEILGYSVPRDAIIRHCKNYIKKKVKTNGGEQLMQIIPKEDVYILISKCKTLSHNEKLKLIKEWNLEEKVLVVETREEIDFKNALIETLKPMNIEIEFQKNIFNGKYKIDFYIPKYNIAIEYDEYEHKYKKQQDKFRQEEIEKLLDCKFIRLSYKNNYNYNVGIVIKEIISSEVK